jgi:predicted esterase
VSSSQATLSADIDGVTVRYAARPAKGDCRELIVVFTSIHQTLDAMDFHGPHGKTMETNRAELLFIHDDFAETYCYYLCRDKSFDVADAIIEFLDRYRRRRKLSWAQVTLGGMSKGGSAALYLGLHLPQVAIVANAPQLRIGTYLRESKRATIVRTMTGTDDQAATAWLNEMMPTALEANTHRNQHLYLFTGPGDTNCFNELAHHATALTRFATTSVVSAGNDAVLKATRASAHHRTLLYFLPTMLSLMGVLAGGLRPQLGFTDLAPNGRAKRRGGRLGDLGIEFDKQQMRRHLRATGR